MGEPVKSILLVDLDGLGHDLAASGGEGIDQRLTERIDDWTGAIESGELIASTDTLQPIAERRCYASAASAEEARAAFAGAGFTIVDCDGEAQIALCLAIDAMEAAAEADQALDFILLTAAPGLTPLVERLRARGHRVAVYAGEASAADYRAAADMVIPASEFAAVLSRSKAPPAPPPPTVDRTKIEAFAREIHAATNIPMLSPKTFADLFRLLADEVAQHGYHFNDTAKNVAERLSEAGRNVTSRQVVFVVKGLALKGHVFSTNDTAERLAEVFREQARYLIGGAGIALDEDREVMLDAWIAAQPAAPAKPAGRPQPAADSKPARPTQPAAAPKPVRKPVLARRPEKPAAAKPSAPPPRVPERPKSATLSAREPPLARDPARPTKASDDLRTAIAARIAASAKLKPSTRPPLKADEPAPPPREEAEAPPEPGADDAIESSILAAIAEAVDVLVEDSTGDEAEAPPAREARAPAARRPAPARPQAAEPPPPPPPPAEEEEEGGDDLGDEIQRIVASYNRNRDGERRG